MQITPRTKKKKERKNETLCVFLKYHLEEVSVSPSRACKRGAWNSHL